MRVEYKHNYVGIQEKEGKFYVLDIFHHGLGVAHEENKKPLTERQIKQKMMLVAKKYDK